MEHIPEGTGCDVYVAGGLAVETGVALAGAQRTLGIDMHGPARVMSVDMIDSRGRSTLNVRRLLRSAYHIAAVQNPQAPPVTNAWVAALRGIGEADPGSHELWC